MPRNAADFMQEWIADHVDEATVTASLDEMVGQCIADAQRAGLSPADVVDAVSVPSVHNALLRPRRRAFGNRHGDARTPARGSWATFPAIRLLPRFRPQRASSMSRGCGEGHAV